MQQEMRSTRLMREYNEVKKCPIPNIVVFPLNEENLSEWHGNIRGAADSEWEDIVVHFTITFPPLYPLQPPTVRLSCFVPHLNVQTRHGLWEVCLDMLELPQVVGVTIPYQNWSSAFSVHSILIQMTSFLLAGGQPTEISIGGINRTILESAAFECPQCGHTRAHPIPDFPTASQVKAAPLSFPSVEVSGEAAEALQAKIYARRLKEHQAIMQQQSKKQSKGPGGADVGCEDNEAHSDAETDKSDTSESSEHVPLVLSVSSVQPLKPPPQWHVVTRKHCLPTPSLKPIKIVPSASVAPSLIPPVTGCPSSADNSYALLNEADSLLAAHVCSVCCKKRKEADYTRSQLAKGLHRKCSRCLQAKTTPSSVHPNHPMELSKSAAKRLRKKTAAAMAVVADATVTTTNASADVELDTVTEADTACTEDSLDYSCGETEAESHSNWKALWQSAEQRDVTDRNMGRFRWLPRDIANCIASFMSATEVLTLGATCRGTASMTDDWLIWRSLFRRRYPRSALCPTGPNSSWRRAYMLEANGLAQDLVCYHSLSTRSDDVLGIPVTYTMNPKTGCLDYATSTFDVLSLQSFARDGVRRTVWGEKFTSFLPLYIDQEHFDRALGQVLKTARKIVGEGVASTPVPRLYERGNGNSRQQSHQKLSRFAKQSSPVQTAWIPRTDPEMALTLLMKMMNTQVVLLCDKGIAASESALLGYCQLHRLMLGLVDKYHSLRVLIRNRLHEFLRVPDSRVKERTPSLGDLLTMLSVSDTVGWREIGFSYLIESFDRSVLWACSRDPSLAKVIPGDESRLDKYLETQKVSMRLTLFHAVFLNTLVQGGGSPRKIDDCADRYDTFQGRPPMYLRRQFQSTVQRILDLDSWPEFFALSGIALPSKAKLLHALETAVSNSLKKGYHSHNTVFQNVMKSGVSKILLKGESYSAAPNLKRIQMLERWRFDGDVIFLDASCLVYDFSRTCLGVVDYSSTTWSGPATEVVTNGRYRYSNRPSCCIEHSGDVIDQGTGTHTITIDITLIPRNVAAMFFTVSAWTTTLKDISQPSAHLHDVDSDTEMCRYKLEDQDTKDNTAVIMCKLHRPSAKDRWALTSIGHVGYGRAGNYTSIKEDIKNCWEI